MLHNTLNEFFFFPYIFLPFNTQHTLPSSITRNSRATPGSWTEINFPCAENGVNCNNKKGGQRAQFYEDPSLNILKEQRRLRG